MSANGLDVRLRRLFAGLDTAPGFEARVLARVASLPAVPVAELRRLYEQSRQETRHRLRRATWLNMVTTVGVGIAAIALIWREGPAVARGMATVLTASSDFSTLAILSCLAIGLGLWVTYWRLAGRL